MNNLDANYWNNRYLNQETSWNLFAVSPLLKAYFEQLSSKNARILIPGCGNAYDAECLITLGFTNITLIDIAEEAIKTMREKFANEPSIRVLHQDFFTLDETFDLVIEQTFFCALDPSLRSRYVSKMHEILVPNGKIAGLLFNKQFVKNPPFGGSIEEYQALFSPFFTIKTMSPCYNSVVTRADTELFVIFCKK